MSNKFNGRGTFFFSPTQAKYRSIGSNNTETEVKLDSGIITGYTEMISEEDSDGSYELSGRGIKTKPFLERFPDGIILGNGIIYSVNGVIKGYEKNYKNNREHQEDDYV